MCSSGNTSGQNTSDCVPWAVSPSWSMYVQGEPLVGEKMLQAVQEMGEGRGMVKLFPEGELGKNIIR